MRRLVLALALAACGGPPPPVVAPVARAAASEFPKDEDRVLHILAAADLRIAQRGIAIDEKELRTAAMGAILNEDATAQIEAGRADLFSFDVRARALDEASKIVAKYDPKDGLESAEHRAHARLRHHAALPLADLASMTRGAVRGSRAR